MFYLKNVNRRKRHSKTSRASFDILSLPTSLPIAVSDPVLTHFRIDMFCWEKPGHLAIDGSRLADAPQEHTMHCLRDPPRCRRGGYGVLRSGPGAGSNFELAYTFDAEGNRLALALVDSSPTIDNVTVTVTGTARSDGVMAVESLADDNAGAAARTGGNCDAAANVPAGFDCVVNLPGNQVT